MYTDFYEIDTKKILDRLMDVTGAKNESKLAEKLGISKAALNMAKHRNAPPYPHLVKVAQTYKVSVDWLLFGEERGGGFVPVSLYEARLSAGGGSMETSSEVVKQYAFRGEWLSSHCGHGKSPDMGLMRVSGNSMEPLIHDGDMVLIDFSQKDCRPGQIYAVSIGELVYLKRVDAAPGELILKSENPQFEPIRIRTGDADADRVQIIGKCIWLCREI